VADIPGSAAAKPLERIALLGRGLLSDGEQPQAQSCATKARYVPQSLAPETSPAIVKHLRIGRVIPLRILVVTNSSSRFVLVPEFRTRLRKRRLGRPAQPSSR